MSWLGYLDANAHVGIGQYFACTFPSFLLWVNPNEVPIVSVMGLILHAFCIPIFSHELLLAAAGSTTLIDHSNSCTGSDRKCRSASVLSLQPMPDVWEGKYTSAFNNNVIIIIVWALPLHLVRFVQALAVIQMVSFNFITSTFQIVFWILVNIYCVLWRSWTWCFEVGPSYPHLLFPYPCIGRNSDHSPCSTRSSLQLIPELFRWIPF